MSRADGVASVLAVMRHATSLEVQYPRYHACYQQQSHYQTLIWLALELSVQTHLQSYLLEMFVITVRAHNSNTCYRRLTMMY